MKKSLTHFFLTAVIIGFFTYKLPAGIGAGESPTAPLSISIEIKAPTIYMLNQNYPNPFNPTTVISYSIPYSSNVSLKVYDVLGKLAATLVNESQEAGNYCVNFNASELSNGIYYYKIESGSFIAVKKMLLLK
jgi:hypothetical protein